MLKKRMDKKLSKLITAASIVELKKIETLLNSRGLPFMVRSFEDTAYDGLFTLGRGKGDILVYQKDHKKAVLLMKEEGLL